MIIKKKYIEPKSYVVDEVEDITDEIELALLALKRDMDLPTEEVERSILSRRTIVGKVR
jgi:hypothetical protein